MTTDHGVDVYPNPANGLFNFVVETVGSVSHQVFNSRGRVVSQDASHLVQKSSCVNWEGVHAIQLITPEGNFTQKLKR